jgi:hypothetical protein
VRVTAWRRGERAPPWLALLLSLPAALQTDAQIPPLDVETLTPVAALPAHIAGSFQALTACQQTPAVTTSSSTGAPTPSTSCRAAPTTRRR